MSAALNKPDVYVSFDLEHDEELYEQLVVDSRKPTSGFAVSNGSTRLTVAEAGGERLRDRIREADQVIVICGEHTGGSASVSAELRFAQEERTPYFLLWGRRDAMCKKPTGAKPTDGMYSWTPRILQDQLTETRRKADAEASSRAAREAKAAARTQS